MTGAYASSVVRVCGSKRTENEERNEERMKEAERKGRRETEEAESEVKQMGGWGCSIGLGLGVEEGGVGGKGGRRWEAADHCSKKGIPRLEEGVYLTTSPSLHLSPAGAEY